MKRIYKYKMMEPKSIQELVFVLKILNPGIKFGMGDENLDSRHLNRIFSSHSPDRIILPEGFVYDPKNGITNKHSSESGLYMAIDIEKRTEKNKHLCAKTFTLPDISQSTNVADLYGALKLLNPNVSFALGTAQNPREIVSSVDMKELRLPNGFDFDGRGITNKHNTKAGAFLVSTVKTNEDVLSLGGTNRPVVPNISQTTRIADVYEAMKILNPDVDFGLCDPNFCTNPNGQMYSSVDISKLVLPEGFEYDEKNGLTNKHHTESGAYMSIALKNLNTANAGLILAEENVSRYYKTTEQAMQAEQGREK